MNWLRSKARGLSSLALVALAMQLGLSFGHVHSDRAFASKVAISGQASTSSSAPSPDSGRDPDGRADLCAICATIALANTLIDSVPPVLPLPMETVAPKLLAASIANGPSTHLFGFQSRAPPQS